LALVILVTYSRFLYSTLTFHPSTYNRKKNRILRSFIHSTASFHVTKCKETHLLDVTCADVSRPARNQSQNQRQNPESTTVSYAHENIASCQIAAYQVLLLYEAHPAANLLCNGKHIFDSTLKIKFKKKTEKNQ
jgi:hypothetical protein